MIALMQGASMARTLETHPGAHAFQVHYPRGPQLLPSLAVCQVVCYAACMSCQHVPAAKLVHGGALCCLPVLLARSISWDMVRAC